MSYPPSNTPLIPNRPLAFGDIMQSVFALYKRGFATIVLIALMPSVVTIVAFVAGLILIVAPLVPLLLNWASFGSFNPFGWGLGAGSMIGGFLVIMVGALLAFVAQYWAGATVATAIAELDQGGRPTFGSLWRANRGLIGRCFGMAGIMVGLSMAFGVLVIMALLIGTSWRYGAIMIWFGGALLVGALVVWGRLALTMPALGIEKLGPWAAVQRSWRLTEFSVWRVVGITWLVSFLINVGSNVVSSIGQLAVEPFLSQATQYYPGSDVWPLVLAAMPVLLLISALQIVYSVVTIPLLWMVNTVLYHDLRRRDEAGLNRPQPRASAAPQFGGAQYPPR